MRRFATTTLLLITLATARPALGQEAVAFDWHVWEYLTTQDGGRQKPLDSLAWETLCTLAHRTSLADPDTGRRLSAVQLYLMMLFDWRGWDQPQTMGTGLSGHSHRAYFGLHQGDKWDHLPWLRVNEPELRSALGIDKSAKCISPYELSQAKIEVPATHDQRPFLLWAEGLSRRKVNELDAYENSALELARRYWSYEQHRMGQRLRVIPASSGPDQPWMTVAEFLRQVQRRTDPTGRLHRPIALECHPDCLSKRRCRRIQSGVRRVARNTSGTGTRRSPLPFAIPLATRSALQPLGSLAHGLDLHAIGRPVPAVARGIAAARCPAGGMERVCVRTGGDRRRVCNADRHHRTSAGDQYAGVGGVCRSGRDAHRSRSGDAHRGRHILTVTAALAAVAFVLADNCAGVLDARSSHCPSFSAPTSGWSRTS